MNTPAEAGETPRWAWGVLGVILLAGAALRLVNAQNNLGFAGDQGEYLLAVIRWLRGGEWPLLGQHRAVTGDFTIGPGWFYTIAPGFALTGFHPAGGVITQTVFYLAGSLLAFHWLRATTRSHLAALFFPLCMALSHVWIGNDRGLWPPHILHFGTMGLAVALMAMPRRPLRALTAILALWAILPHWHTTGIVVAMVSLPFVLWRLRGALPVLKQTARARLAVAMGLLAVWIALLYGPPLAHELSDGEPNLLRWLGNSLLPVPPSEYTLGANVRHALDLIGWKSLNLALGWPTVVEGGGGSTRHVVSAFMAVTVAAALFFARRHRRHIDASVGFLAAMLGVFFALMIAKAEHFDGYYMQSAFHIPVLLTVWAAGIFLAGGGPGGHSAPRALGGVWLILGLLAIVMQLPAALSAPFDRENPFRRTMTIAEWIAKDAAGAPISVTLIEPVNYSPHYHALLARAGNEPLNARIDSKSIPREAMGARAYVIVAGRAVTESYAPVIRGLDPAHYEVEPFERAFVMRIDPAALPAGAGELVCGYDMRTKSFFILPNTLDNPIEDPIQF